MTAKRESVERTQRLLGLVGIISLAAFGLGCITALVIIVLNGRVGATGSAITALGTIAATCAGGLAGWIARPHSYGLYGVREAPEPNSDLTAKEIE